jgi:hypothetical protein
MVTTRQCEGVVQAISKQRPVRQIRQGIVVRHVRKFARGGILAQQGVPEHLQEVAVHEQPPRVWAAAA